ncbi:MAG: GIY-YIG nuclease family protein [Firmicutes bacterium]|nr:GIY-YIG nuclease family protein [Bacillota bacterium]
MWAIYVSIGIFVLFVAALLFVYLRQKSSTEIQPKDIDVLVDYVKAQKQEADEVARVKLLKKEEQKSKLETFKQTKEQLKEKLKSQIDQKEWKSLNAILSSADKGGVGIYIIFNQTKSKYYVGQAKQINARIRKHFDVPDLARDFLMGDQIHVKFLTANELDDAYRLDHIEKTGIEIFNADKSGYNKTVGNL